jgi:cytochrome oxidase Cu insertion factor (SCO1/SenC/PrrC family)
VSLPSEEVRLGPLWFLLALFALGFPAFFLFDEEKPYDFGPVPDFVLVDQLSVPFQKGDMVGKPAVVDFIFTRCQNVCPKLTASMSELQEKISGEEALFLSFSVDPQHDTSEVLAEYAGRFSADQSRWKFLTGEPDQLKPIMEGFQIAYKVLDEKDGVPDILHSQKFILIDRRGHIRGFYRTDTEGEERLLRDLKSL